MKMKSIFVPALATLMLFVACSKEETDPNLPNGGDSADVAYLSLQILAEGTRSSEQTGDSDENEVKSVYIVTFDASKNVLKTPGEPRYYLDVATAVTTPPAFRISADAKGLMVVVNPGDKLKSVITNLNSSSTYTSLNAAITGIDINEMTKNTNGFVMISAGDDTGLSANAVIADPLVTLTSSNIFTVGGTDLDGNPINTEAEAKVAAEDGRARVKVLVERLASKLEFKVKTPNPEVLPIGATFSLIGWTVDALNTTYFPYAKKTILGTNHTTGVYTNNFYTEDPNYTNNTGITYTTVDPDTFEPILIYGPNWLADNTKAYTVENTMKAEEQRYENATRMVIKGTYYPVSTWTTGDWFSFANVNYRNLQELKDAYDVVGATNLQTACDDMFDKIKAYLTNNNLLPMNGSDFSTLSEADLAKIPNSLGGEVIKTKGSAGVEADPCIRWYQNGLSYYYYEIRHDKHVTDQMAFGKYGVVRNNYYSLTLSKVNGAGTPWYPDINEPGPGDPDPTDPIDEAAGFLGIDIERAPWILWNYDIEI